MGLSKSKPADVPRTSSVIKPPSPPPEVCKQVEASIVADTPAIDAVTVDPTTSFKITSSKSYKQETKKENVNTMTKEKTSDEDADKLLEIYDELESRVYALECIKRVKQRLLKLNILSKCRFIKVPPEYYDLTMEQRAKCLHPCKVNQMCKSIVFENKLWRYDNNDNNNSNSNNIIDKSKDKNNYTLEESLSDRTNSRYYLLVVQYNAKFSTADLEDTIRNLRPEETRLARKRFNFQLANNGEELTGFRHNAVCPFGIVNEDKYQIPVFISKACLEASNAYIYMGGGAVDVKLGIPLNTFIKATNAGVADVSQAR